MVPSVSSWANKQPNFSTTKSEAVECSAASLFSYRDFGLQRIFSRQLVPQAVVHALLCQQLFVGTRFHDALFAQHKDAVVVLDGGQAVGNGQGGAAVGQFFQALTHQDLALVVQCAGGLASFLVLTRQFNQPISQISMQLNSVVMALAGGARIFALLDEKPEVNEGDITLVHAKYEADDTVTEANESTGMWAWKRMDADGKPRYTKLEGDIVFKDVDFGYDEKKIVLHDINLYGRPGQKIAFVGSTGAGKTTITNLINRFYDIQKGRILYDGHDIKSIEKDALRSSLGIVLQDTHLFTGTVMENIRYGRLTATDEECMAAAKLANADTFIKHLPDGYNTMLTGDGTNLSQGQRQLLAIARAAVADPPVLILDEATSSIDTRTEKLVQDGMDGLMYGRTTFLLWAYSVR